MDPEVVPPLSDNDPNTESDVDNHRHDLEGNEPPFISEED